MCAEWGEAEHNRKSSAAEPKHPTDAVGLLRGRSLPGSSALTRQKSTLPQLARYSRE